MTTGISVPQVEFIVEADTAGERLDRALARQCRDRSIDLSNKQAKVLVNDGAVRVDGRVTRKASRAVALGEAVSARIPEVASDAPPLADLSDAVIYRDDVLLVVSKPSGLPTHGTHDPLRDHALAAVLRLVADDGYAAIHHRLDVETSGVLAFAIDRSANKGLADAFAQREAKKTYLALVGAVDIPDQFDVEDHLGRHRHDTRKMCAVRSGGDFARTRFRVLARSAHAALVQAEPETGRTHQIRVHLSEVGAPILGDLLYGGTGHVTGQPVGRVMLHAFRLELPHPVSREPLDLRAEPPDDFERLARSLGLNAYGS